MNGLMRRRWRWIAEADLFLYFCVTLAVVGLACHALDFSEKSVRLTGMTLQLLGIGCAIEAIGKTREYFKLPSLRSKVMQWIKRYPRRSAESYVAADGLAIGADIIRGSLNRVLQPPRAGDSVEQQIAHVYEQLKFLDQRVDGNKKQLEQEIDRLSSKVRVANREVGELLAATHSRIEESATGGLALAALGAAWLIVGVVLASASPEIHEWFQ